MGKYTRFLVCLYLWAGAVTGFAQKRADVIVSGTYQEQSLESVLQSIEKQAAEQQHPLRFFYDVSATASLTISVTLSQTPLPEALEKILADTDLRFVPYNTSYMVLLPRLEVLSLSGNTLSTETVQPLTEQSIETTQTRTGMKLLTHKKGTRVVAISGHVTDAASGKKLQESTIYVEELREGVLADEQGKYTLTLPVGVYNLVFSYVGYQSRRRQVTVKENLLLNMPLTNTDIRLREVVVSAEATDKNVSTTQMSVSRLSIRTIKKMPPLLGEVDLVRSILLLPGVSTVGEGSTGFNVRGGSIDQNLVMMDHAPIYNTSHMFGLFSIFNPDIVKEVMLHRGGIPAKFGGRASSVLDIQLKDANAKKLAFQGGIGLISSRLSVEAPLIKDKLSFIVAGRGSFMDFLLKLSPNESLKHTRANFYDLNGKIDYRLNEKNNLSLSGYISNDFLQLQADSISPIAVNSDIIQYRWQNAYGIAQWKHVWTDKLIQTTAFTYTTYQSEVRNPQAPNTYTIPSRLAQQKMVSDFDYHWNEKHKLSFGIQATNYQLSPENLHPSADSDVRPIVLSSEKGIEGAAYLEDNFILSPKLTLTAGLRYSMYSSLGPATVYRYRDTGRELINLLDSTVYEAGKPIQTYGGLEPRVALKVSLTESSSIKVSYSRMRQYIHLISNTAAAIPTARWKLSDTHIQPQVADQFAVGYFRNFTGNMFETSVEVYYKDLSGFLDYKDNAVVFLNRTIETAVLQGKGKSYGVELMVKKAIGEYVTGWASYTYARTFVQMNSRNRSEQVNNGAWYPANFDKPHTFNLVLNYQFKKRSGVSLNFTYSTGRPLTLPEGKFYYDGLYIPDFGLRNQGRIPDYHRLDLAWNIDSGYRKKKKVDKSWTVAVYNLYSRNNAYSIFFQPQSRSGAYKLSIFGAAFPSITYNFKF